MDAVIRRPIEIGAAIRRLREDRGMTQEQLAAKLRASRRWVGQLERGKNPGAQFSMISAAVTALGAELRIVTKEDAGDRNA
jgi:transcriptional regulator with XRE-family HTH domain